MIAMTVADVVKGYRGNTQGHYLYLYRDGEAILYVGKSIHPLERLLQHLGYSVPSLPDAIGMLIQDNLPNSLFWAVELYTPAECGELVQMYQASSVPAFQQGLAQAIYDDDAVSIAEEAMIEHYQPHMNIKGVRYVNPLPDRYVKRKIVNEGLTLPQSFTEEFENLTGRM